MRDDSHHAPPPDNAGASPAQKRRLGRVRVEGVRCDRGEPIDLSARGMRLRTRRAWAVGESRSIMLRTSGVRLAIRARCAWVRREALLRHVIGLTFDEVSAAQQETIGEMARTHAARTPRRRAA